MVFYGANPVYSLPASWEFEKALAKVPLVISLSSFPDETTERATLIMPAATFLESWGDYSPQARVTGLLQPAMGRFFDTKPMGDILLMLGKGVSGQARFPEKDFYEVLRGSWEQKRKEQGRRSFGRAILAAKPSAGRDMGGGKGSAVWPGESLSLYLLGPGEAPCREEAGTIRLIRLSHHPVLRRPPREPSLAPGDARPRYHDHVERLGGDRP